MKVGLINIEPKADVLKILESFEKYPYCPKCGVRLDYEELKQEI